MYLPTDIANLALDAIGSPTVLGDIEDGTREAQICLRSYRECLMQLLRGAHWQFARKDAPMQLLADATGQTDGVGALVVPPWIYEYAYPTDCVAVRFIPFRPFGDPAPAGNIAIATTPIATALAVNPAAGHRLRPARFLIARDYNYPPLPGQITWEVQGLSPEGRTVVLTNVPNARAVYTSLVRYPSEWDALFRAAMVAYLASAICMSLAKNRQEGMALRRDQIAIVKQKLEAARLADGNETWSTTDRTAEWIAFRNSGGGFGWRHGEDDGGFCGWSSVNFADGSAY